jgi:hypothetical protein
MSEHRALLAGLVAAARRTPRGKAEAVLREYYLLVAEATGAPKPEGIPSRGMPWRYACEAVALAEALGVDPVVWVRAQFSEFGRGPSGERYPYLTMLASETAVHRWYRHAAGLVRRYADNAEAAGQAVGARGEIRSVVQAALATGTKMWARMRAADPGLTPLAVAASAPGLLPAAFLLSFREVEDAVRSGAIDALGEDLARLEADPEAWAVILETRRK